MLCNLHELNFFFFAMAPNLARIPGSGLGALVLLNLALTAIICHVILQQE